MWVREVQGKRLIDAVFKQRNDSGGYDVVAVPRGGNSLRSATNWSKLRCRTASSSAKTRAVAHHRHRTTMCAASDLLNAEYPNRPSDLTWPQLWTRRDVVVAEIAQLRRTSSIRS